MRTIRFNAILGTFVFLFCAAAMLRADDPPKKAKPKSSTKSAPIAITDLKRELHAAGIAVRPPAAEMHS